jgi:cell division protein FtsL
MAGVSRASARIDYAPRRERHSRAARKERRRRRLIVSIAALALVALVLVHVWLRLQVVHMGYALSSTARLQAQLEQEQRELKVELTSLSTPERLQAMARQRLGLASPEKGQVIVLP